MPTYIFNIKLFMYLFIILAFLSIPFPPSMHCTCKSTWGHHSVCDERWLECLCGCLCGFFFPSLFLQMEEWCSRATGAPSSSSFSSENRKRDIYCRWKRESSQTRGAVGGWVWGGGEQQGEGGRESIRQEKQGRREGWRGNMREQGDAETGVRLSEEGKGERECK